MALVAPRPMFALKLVLLAALAAGPVSAAARVAPSDAVVSDSIRALEEVRGQALLNADTLTLSRLVANEFIEISRLGDARRKSDNLSDIATGRLKLTSVKYDSLTVRVYGDVAVLFGIANNKGTFHGVPWEGRIRYMRVFVRRDGRWQAVASQQTALP